MVIRGNVVSSKSVSGIVNRESSVQGSVSRADNIYVKELTFKNYYEFPTIGETDKLYIAENENAIYVFDDSQNIYKCIGRDYNEIQAIMCKLKED